MYVGASGAKLNLEEKKTLKVFGWANGHLAQIIRLEYIGSKTVQYKEYN